MFKRKGMHSKFGKSLRDPPYCEVVIGHTSPVIRRGLQALVEANGAFSIAATVESAEEASSQLGNFPGALALLDNELPGGGALAVVCSGVESGDRRPVVSMIAGVSENATPWGFCQGIADPIGPESEIMLALTVAASGGTYVSNAVQGLSTRLTIELLHDSLTQREVHVLREIAHGQGSKQIAFAENISIETVKSHVANAMRKLHVGTRAHAVAKAYEQGLLGEEPTAVARSTIAGIRHTETMLYSTYAEAAQETLRYLRRRLGFDLWLIAEAFGEEWVALQTVGDQMPLLLDFRESFGGRVLAGDAPKFSADAERVPGYEESRLFSDNGIRAYVCTPVVDGDGFTAGTLCAFARQPLKEPMNEADLRLVEGCASLLGSLLPLNVEVPPPPSFAMVQLVMVQQGEELTVSVT